MIRRAVLSLLLLCVMAFPARAAVVDVSAVVATMLADGDAAVTAYSPERKGATADIFSDLYFDSFEGSGLEGLIGVTDSTLKTSLEGKFARLIGLARKGEPDAEISAAWGSLRADLAKLPERLAASQPQDGFLGVFLQALLILAREGFEAILVVAALVSYLSRSGAADKVRVVYYGVGWALVASLLTAWVLASLIKVSGEASEVLEGATMLLASVVLFYCSYWLFAKREAARWQNYVQAQVAQAVSGGRLFTLGFAAFLAVYREGAETVLFYRALYASAPGQLSSLLAGMGAGIVILAAIYAAMRALSLRLPLGVFFAVTAGLLYYLAVVFAGKGVVELQNGKALSITPLAGWPSLDWLGFFPTAEGVAAQGMLLLPLLAGFAWLYLRRRAANAA